MPQKEVALKRKNIFWVFFLKNVISILDKAFLLPASLSWGYFQSEWTSKDYMRYSWHKILNNTSLWELKFPVRSKCFGFVFLDCILCACVRVCVCVCIYVLCSDRKEFNFGGSKCSRLSSYCTIGHHAKWLLPYIFPQESMVKISQPVGGPFRTSWHTALSCQSSRPCRGRP